MVPSSPAVYPYCLPLSLPDALPISDCLIGAPASFRHGLPLEHRRVSVRSTVAKSRVPFLLPTFSLGKQRKVGRPIGRNQRPNRERDSKFATRRDRQGGV